MKKGTLTIIVIVALVLILGIWMKNSYNGMVKGQEKVSSAWSQVENVYQRRADLVPNLVATVKGYAAHESSTFEAVTAARAKATSTTIDASTLKPEDVAKYQQAQGELSTAIGRLLMITENYPDLKANQNFMELQAQLEGTENRIATERMKFNDTAREYNTMVRSFPANIIAGMFNFETKGYFEADKEAQKVPKVNF